MLLALFCALVEPALAASDDYFASAEVTSAVDIPLYANMFQGSFLYVEVKVGEKAGLVRLATSHNDLFLSSEGQAFFGVKPNKKGEGKIDELSMGGLTLQDVKFVSSGEEEEPDPRAFSGLQILGEIGLTGIEGASWAILPSAGVLKVVPAADGSKLISELGGATLDYHLTEESKEKIGAGPKTEFMGGRMMVDASFSGVKLDTIFAIDDWSSWVIREVDGALPYATKDVTFTPSPLPAAPTLTVGEYDMQWRSVDVAGIQTDAEIWRIGRGPLALFARPARVGQSVLSGLDIVIDTANSKLGLKQASALKTVDYRPTWEAALRKTLEPAPVKEGEEAPSAEDQKKARAAAIPTVADYLVAQGNFTDALSLWREVTEVDAKQCTSWLNYGQVAFMAGKYDVAIEASTKAGEIYDAWAKLSLEERTELSKEYEKAKDKDAYTGALPQSHDCHVAWGNAAMAQLANGNPGAAVSLYQAHRDLDNTLAVVAGNAYLIQGKTEDARAAYQQAIAMHRHASYSTRSGLMIVHGSNWDLVDAQLDSAEGYKLTWDAMSLRNYFAAAKAAGGVEAALKAAQSLVDSQPGNYILLIEAARVFKAAGKDQAAAKFMADADKLISHDEKAYATTGFILTARAQYLLADGKLEEAKTAALEALKLDSLGLDAYLVLADAYAAQGNQEKAAEFKKKAASVGAFFPAYATLAAK